ncbi:MAG: hypothetical protein JWM41_2911 [Gemmatimonadetes bacterium]|nr:hypothetical protein [Gemmatimonadota bacterium]
MATTLQQIIESGIARSTANDPGKLTVDGELIPLVNRKYQSIFARMSLQGGDNLLAKTTLTFASSPPFVTLPTDIVDIIRFELAGGGRTYLVPVRDKDRTWVLAPAVYRQGNTIVSLARAGDPAAGDVWTLFYKDAPATLSALASTLDTRYPVRYENALVVEVALYMAVKDENRSPERIVALQRELDTENKMIDLLIGGSDSAESTPHPTAGSAANT